MQSRDVGRTGRSGVRGPGGAGPGDRPAEVGTPEAPRGDLVLRTRPNWTAVGFLGLLGGAHLTFAALSFANRRWEGYLSLMLGTVFVAAAAVAVAFRFELAVLPSRRRVRLRHGVGRFAAERFVPFSSIRGVRLTFAGADHHAGREGGADESSIELLCPYDSIECPPTSIPRQEALYLAMALNVPLIKVSQGPARGDPFDRGPI